MQATSHTLQTTKCSYPEFKHTLEDKFIAIKRSSKSRSTNTPGGFQFSCMVFVIDAKIHFRGALTALYSACNSG